MFFLDIQAIYIQILNRQAIILLLPNHLNPTSDLLCFDYQLLSQVYHLKQNIFLFCSTFLLLRCCDLEIVSPQSAKNKTHIISALISFFMLFLTFNYQFFNLTFFLNYMQNYASIQSSTQLLSRCNRHSSQRRNASLPLSSI